MINNLLSGVVSNTQSGNSTPDGYASLSLSASIIIIISVIFLIILAIIVCLIIYKTLKKEKKTEQEKNKISNKDTQFLLEYNKLTPKEKQIIEDTINTFNKTKEK